MAEVAVVTRTRSRPLLLERAFASLSSQTLRNFVWVLVNDGGDKPPVEDVAARARKAGMDVLLRHIETSRGMEAASNDGIRNSSSSYVAIHDDDDTWEPPFLAEAVNFLETSRHYAGVVTHATRLSERIDGSRITELARKPHLPHLHAVHLADLARANLFPPIAFCYRRSLYDAVGGYDETMQILGDWDFNLRALLKGDIGVIPKILANYHVRDGGPVNNGTYANSITPGALRQHEADAAYRNRKLREDLASGKPGLGMLLALGRLEAGARQRRMRLTGVPSATTALKNLFKKGAGRDA